MSQDEKNEEENLQTVTQIEEEQLQGFSFIKTLGKGNFGKVKLGMHVLTGEHVAIKILQKDLIFEKADIERITREMKIMKQIRHPHIVQLFEIVQKPKRLYFIMEYADGGDLFDLIVNSERLGEAKSAIYFTQILKGLEHLHRQGIAHRDMKPQNILISGDQIKIADFGLGNFFKSGEMLKTACGSPCYASPEMLQRVPYNPEKVDIWSTGIILYAMVCGYLPFEDEVTAKLYEKIKTINPRYPKFLTDGLKNLLKKILDKNPQTRLTIDQIKQDEWLKNAFYSTKVEEFQLDEQKLAKICKNYGINDQQKLASYLRRNKHNNLTTIYYLACRGNFDEDVIEEETNVEVNNEMQAQGDQNNNEDHQNSDNIQNLPEKHAESSEILPEYENVFKYTESEIEGVPEENENQKQTQDEVKQKEQEQEKELEKEKDEKLETNGRSEVIQNQVSFGDLQKFSDFDNKNRNQETEILHEQNNNSEKELNNFHKEQQTENKMIENEDVTHKELHQSEDSSMQDQNNEIENNHSSNSNTESDYKGTEQPNEIQTEEEQKNKIDFVRKAPQKKEQHVEQNSSSRIKTFSKVTRNDEPKNGAKNMKNIKQEHLYKSTTIERQTAINFKDSESLKKDLNKSVTIPTNQKKPETSKNVVEENKTKLNASNQLSKRNSKNRNQDISPASDTQIQEIDKAYDKKPKLVKTGRMEMVRSAQTNINRKAPLNEKSHSKDKTITTKKIIGKAATSEPFLIDTSKIVLCNWATLSSVLTQRGAEGRIQFFSYGKNGLYISKSSIRGIRSLKQVIQKINSKEIY